MADLPWWPNRSFRSLMWRPSPWIIRRMDSLRAEISLLSNREGGRRVLLI